ncbi:MAG: ABC transporter permease subunit [Chloroflexota bacterium]|nr:ABC transporter permease subunit [Chloroflexota bacterium]
MTVASRAYGIVAARPTEPGEAKWVIAWHVARSAAPLAAVWGLVFGMDAFITVWEYPMAYPTLADRVKAAVTLRSFSVLYGQPYHAETVAGYVSWHVTTVVSLIGTIWALLVSTGLLRGEEDAGRWEMLLSGPVSKARATAEALVGLGAALVAMFVPTFVTIVAAAQLPVAHFSVPSSLLLALTLVSAAAMFLAIGALASQVSATRGQAATVVVAVAGVAFLVRMVADARKGLDWILWLTPYGWIEQLRPLRDPQVVAFAPIFLLVAGCVVATLAIASERDLGASVLRAREESGATGRWLLGPTTLALRLVRGTVAAWLVGIAIYSFAVGMIARSASDLLVNSPAFTSALGRLGVRKASEAYLGIEFLMLSALLAVVAASFLASVRDEEAGGRLDHLLVRPTRRIVWLAGRGAIVAVVVAACGALSGAATWVGAETQHTGVPLAKLVEAGINATIPAAFVLGVGLLVFGIAPRLTSVATYGVIAYSFLVTLIASLFSDQEWLKDTSIFSHIEIAPAAKPDWGEASIVFAVALAAAAIGALAFERRDIEYA